MSNLCTFVSIFNYLRSSFFFVGATSGRYFFLNISAMSACSASMSSTVAAISSQLGKSCNFIHSSNTLTRLSVVEEVFWTTFLILSEWWRNKWANSNQSLIKLSSSDIFSGVKPTFFYIKTKTLRQTRLHIDICIERCRRIYNDINIDKVRASGRANNKWRQW